MEFGMTYQRKIRLPRSVASWATAAIMGLASLSVAPSAQAHPGEAPSGTHIHSSTSDQIEHAAAGFVWVDEGIRDEFTCHRQGKEIVREEIDAVAYRCEPTVRNMYRLWIKLYI